MSTNVSQATSTPQPQEETRRKPVELSSFFCNNAKEEVPSPHHPPLPLKGNGGRVGVSSTGSSSVKTSRPHPHEKQGRDSKKQVIKQVKHWLTDFFFACSTSWRSSSPALVTDWPGFLAKVWLVSLPFKTDFPSTGAHLRSAFSSGSLSASVWFWSLNYIQFKPPTLFIILMSFNQSLDNWCFIKEK